MSIESPADFDGLARVGRVVAATLKAMADYEHTLVITKEKPILLTAA